MRIAVNAIFLQKDQLEGYGHYVNEIISRLVKQHPEHEFLLVFDRPYDLSFIYAPNVTPVVVTPAARHPLSFTYWYQVKAPAALRKHQPDLWVQPYGFCSLTTRIPQVLVLHDLSFLHYPGFFTWYHRWYYRVFTKRFIRKAAQVVTVSEFSKKDILEQYPVGEQKISVVPNAAADRFRPLPWQEKQQVKVAYSGAKEYFLCTGSIHPRKNLLNLLKAFSQFKKWQHSNMKLIIAGRLAWQHDELTEKLKTYKHRNDVVLTGYLPDEALAQLTAAAYAVVYPSWFEGFGLPVIEAMQAGVPVITSHTSALPETGGDAALYADPANPESIAKHMLALYRDETFRTRQIELGIQQAAKFSWTDSARRFWEAMMKARGGKRE
ncbi:glycosyltransferase family 4 protein [Sediminibacterium soli]|uniref:glycosyltransferase family 4 protein n=1 Tax=Sediminibacterium soli TaxID=2698829 RepID=UPI00137A8CAB|nr:glycosyltransferase family 1 protein [Sediminibacterium soli]NCI47803.1 glycosyltransferase family 4 protein [Sediminibacterium soli]